MELVQERLWMCRWMSSFTSLSHCLLHLPVSSSSLRVCDQLCRRVWTPCSSPADAGLLFPGRPGDCTQGSRAEVRSERCGTEWQPRCFWPWLEGAAGQRRELQVSAQGALQAGSAPSCFYTSPPPLVSPSSSTTNNNFFTV